MSEKKRSQYQRKMWCDDCNKVTLCVIEQEEDRIYEFKGVKYIRALKLCVDCYNKNNNEEMKRLGLAKEETEIYTVFIEFGNWLFLIGNEGYFDN